MRHHNGPSPFNTIFPFHALSPSLCDMISLFCLLCPSMSQMIYPFHVHLTSLCVTWLCGWLHETFPYMRHIIFLLPVTCPSILLFFAFHTCVSHESALLRMFFLLQVTPPHFVSVSHDVVISCAMIHYALACALLLYVPHHLAAFVELLSIYVI